MRWWRRIGACPSCSRRITRLDTIGLCRACRGRIDAEIVAWWDDQRRSRRL